MHHQTNMHHQTKQTCTTKSFLKFKATTLNVIHGLTQPIEAQLAACLRILEHLCSGTYINNNG
jgi:hypothetical protein